MRELKLNKPYRHFKGNLYLVLHLAKDADTGESYVVYQALYDDFQVYIRPYNEFMSEVDSVKYPWSTQKYRFEEFVNHE